MRCMRAILRRLRPVPSSLHVSAALVGLRLDQDAIGRGQAAEEEQRCRGRNFYGRNGSQSCELDLRFWVFSENLDDASPGCWDDIQQIGRPSPDHDLCAMPVMCNPAYRENNDIVEGLNLGLRLVSRIGYHKLA